jgi:hypothetical protein
MRMLASKEVGNCVGAGTDHADAPGGVAEGRIAAQ